LRRDFILSLIVIALTLATCVSAGVKGLSYVLGARQESEIEE
jgi:hypothetical protein